MITKTHSLSIMMIDSSTQLYSLNFTTKLINALKI